MAQQDPNKYRKNAKIKPDTLMHTITSTASILLMCVGIIGLALGFFKKDGWVSQLFGWLFATSTHMMLIPVIIGALWLLNRWFSGTSKNETRASGNIPMYLMMAVGAYYIYRVLTTGEF
jgi:hypothetical protein